jgi:hypothetical protein
VLACRWHPVVGIIISLGMVIDLAATLHYILPEIGQQN